MAFKSILVLPNQDDPIPKVIRFNNLLKQLIVLCASAAALQLEVAFNCESYHDLCGS